MEKGLARKTMKKNSDELQEYLQFKRRGSKVKPKKGKGSYRRNRRYYSE